MLAAGHHLNLESLQVVKKMREIYIPISTTARSLQRILSRYTGVQLTLVKALQLIPKTSPN
jgi:hypothetical protein